MPARCRRQGPLRSGSSSGPTARPAAIPVRPRPGRRSTTSRGPTPATTRPSRTPRSRTTSASRPTTSPSTPGVVRALELARELGAREVAAAPRLEADRRAARRPLAGQGREADPALGGGPDDAGRLRPLDGGPRPARPELRRRRARATRRSTGPRRADRPRSCDGPERAATLAEPDGSIVVRRARENPHRSRPPSRCAHRLLIAACGGSSESSRPPDAVAGWPATLAGTNWGWSRSQASRRSRRARRSSASRADRAQGTGGCNMFGGAYTYDPTTGTLTIGELMSTLMACIAAAGRPRDRLLRRARGSAARSARRTATCSSTAPRAGSSSRRPPGISSAGRMASSARRSDGRAAAGRPVRREESPSSSAQGGG